jgi:hypothetical protein
MGMYDTVYMSSDVAAAWRLRCPKCGLPPVPDRVHSIQDSAGSEFGGSQRIGRNQCIARAQFL